MSEAKFTGGVWGLEYGLVVICGIHYEFDNAYDAHLISAAPEMYEVLETIVDCSTVKIIDLGDGMTIDIESIKQLLVKARGEL